MTTAVWNPTLHQCEENHLPGPIGPRPPAFSVGCVDDGVSGAFQGGGELFGELRFVFDKRVRFGSAVAAWKVRVTMQWADCLQRKFQR